MRYAAGRTRHLLFLVSIIIWAACFAAACDDIRPATNRAPFGGIVNPSPSFGVFVQPQSFAVQSFSTFNCLAVTPLATSFAIVVQNPPFDVSLHGLDMRFVNGSSLGGTPVPIPSPDLSQTFGSTLVRAGTSRTFAFTPSFGCIPLASTSLVINVTLIDASGSPQQIVLNAPIR